MQGQTGRQERNTGENRQTGGCQVIRIPVDSERCRGSETDGETADREPGERLEEKGRKSASGQEAEDEVSW